MSSPSDPTNEQADDVSVEELTVGINLLTDGSSRNPYELRNAVLLQEQKRIELYKNGYTINSATGRALEAEFRLGSNSYHSRKLDQNMQASGQHGPKPCNTAAHHIVHSGGRSPIAERARQILFRNGIGINDSDNDVYLPQYCKSDVPSMQEAHPHSTIHTNDYRTNVLTLVTLGESSGGAAGIRDMMKTIARDLSDRIFPLYGTI